MSMERIRTWTGHLFPYGWFDDADLSHVTGRPLAQAQALACWASVIIIL